MSVSPGKKIRMLEHSSPSAFHHLKMQAEALIPKPLRSVPSGGVGAGTHTARPHGRTTLCPEASQSGGNACASISETTLVLR